MGNRCSLALSGASSPVRQNKGGETGVVPAGQDYAADVPIPEESARNSVEDSSAQDKREDATGKTAQLEDAQGKTPEELKRLEEERKERRKKAKESARMATGGKASGRAFLSEADTRYVASPEMGTLKQFIAKNKEKSSYVSCDEYEQQAKLKIHEGIGKKAAEGGGPALPAVVPEADEEIRLNDALNLFSPDIPFQARLAEFEYLLSKREGVAEHVASETAKMKAQNKKEHKQFMSMA
mmetsp:Transcript_15949/g.40490  ORF Transcript_15949/g.40490 Transcript_15949/m.40490 type:complete len:239 (+) Transcript_15949:120-836(+)